MGERDATEEQARVEARLRLRHGRIATAVVAGALAVLVAVVALLGGFGERKDLLTPVAPGSLIVTGPYEVTFDKAGVRHKTYSDEWEVIASGTVRTTGSTSIRPSTGSSGFVSAQAAAGGEVQRSESVTLGGTGTTRHLDNLTPGLPPVPWSVSFSFPQEPSGELVLGVYQQEYTTPYLFSDELGWRSTRSASTLRLPLERLPDQKY